MPVVDDDRVDLVVNYAVKVQVKGSRASAGYAWNFTRKVLDNGRRTHARQVSPHVDVFLFHGQATDEWWVVPREHLEMLGWPRSVTVGQVAYWKDRWDEFARD